MHFFWSAEYQGYLFRKQRVRTLLTISAFDIQFIWWLLSASLSNYRSSLFCLLFIWCLFHISRSFFLHLRFSCLSFCVHCVPSPVRLIWYRFPPSVGKSDGSLFCIFFDILFFVLEFLQVFYSPNFDLNAQLHTGIVVFLTLLLFIGFVSEILRWNCLWASLRPLNKNIWLKLMLPGKNLNLFIFTKHSWLCSVFRSIFSVQTAHFPFILTVFICSIFIP